MLRSRYLALAACALSVVLSACGGGGSDDDEKEPLAGDISLSATEDTPVTAGLDFAGGPAATATLVTAPVNGTVVFTSGSPLTLTYTPKPNVFGTDFFTYTITNDGKTSNLGSVVVSINPVDDPPVIATSLTVNEDASVTATLISDLEGDKFTSAIVTPPAHGTLTVDGTNPGLFTYTPAADFNGADSAEISATYDDFAAGASKTITGTIAITVNPVDDPPAGVADTVRTMQGVAARFEPLANDHDIDGDALAIRIVSAPSAGTATVNADGSIEYTPSPSFVGNTSLEYEVRDAAGLTSRATVSIEVALTSGILYLSRPDIYSPNELYFADGARSFKVNAPLAEGDSVTTLAAAKSGPVVFYQTQLSQGVYRVDLREPGVAKLVDPAAPEMAAEFAGVDLSKPAAAANAVALSPQLLQQFGATASAGPQAADGSFAVVVARDLHAVSLHDNSQVDITSGVIAEKPTLIPNF